MKLKLVLIILIFAGIFFYFDDPITPEASLDQPLIILHGFNPTYSSKLSFVTMNDISKQLADDFNSSVVTFDGSCDTIKSDSIIQVSYFPKRELVEIPVYSDNLKSAINTITTCTNSNVNILAHSMGGVVARHYIQQSKDPKINKLIMLGTPNHGGMYTTTRLFDEFVENGESKFHLDFLQLSENHQFMQQLNKQQEKNMVRYFTVAGNIDGKGDGLILASSVPLESSTNIKVDCNHWFIKHPGLCEDAYAFVKESLTDAST